MRAHVTSGTGAAYPDRMAAPPKLVLASVVALAIALPAVAQPAVTAGAGAKHGKKKCQRRHGKKAGAARKKCVNPTAGTPTPATPAPQADWPAVGTNPLSDAQAAALVTHVPETRPNNAAANDYVPSDAELQAFHAALDNMGQRGDVVNPLRAYVTGRTGLGHPSTDDVIQWAAHKWGIPEDWMRAQAVVETYWRQEVLGDRTTVAPALYAQYPPQAQVPGTSDAFQSMGLMQVRWVPDGSLNPGTEPLRWKSTAFNVDVYGAIVRYYYDGLCSWCTAGYAPGQAWNSIGAWFNPYPWINPGAQNYVATVQQRLAERTWASSDF
jgi:hypothetical protein